MTSRSGKSEMLELDPPPEAIAVDSAQEIVRAWIADGRFLVTLEAESFKHNVGESGRVLAGVTHHIAAAIAMHGSLTEREALAAIAEIYDRGVTSGSTVVSGRLRH